MQLRVEFALLCEEMSILEKKVVLILIDGMRPDGMLQCGNPYVSTLLDQSAYTLTARTVMPSITLPCHMSLFHSVDPDRHGVLTNVYTPQVRPIDGLFELLHRAGKSSAIFYNWEELRDLSRPGSLQCSVMLDQHMLPDTDRQISALAVNYIQTVQPDCVFIYLGETDEKGGHDNGWMSSAYLQCVANAIDCVRTIREGIPAEYDVILTADHGGHERLHGTDRDVDMLIPIILNGPSFPAGQAFSGGSINDIAPTIVHLLGISPAREWEGHVLHL